jgi:curli biogenesis system outer membrane secretion channel CsgG
LADRVQPPLRIDRRLLLAGLAAMAPALARSGSPASSPIPGPRRRVVVRPFEVTPSFASASVAEAAAIIQAALLTRLEDTGCCTAVERGALAVSNGASAPTHVDVPPPQFIFAGSVTINPPPDVGGISEFDGPGRRRGSVEMDVRLSDAHTAMVLDVFQAERRISASGRTERGGGAGAPSRADVFFASPLGQATDLALADIVAQIVGALAALG